MLDELSGPLCDAVLERSGSARVLRDLARSNSLVVSLDRNDDSYRYHHLFAEMLRSELRRRSRRGRGELHARASRWYAAHSDPDHAIDHAIAAGELERAGELIWLAFPEVSGRGESRPSDAGLARSVTTRSPRPPRSPSPPRMPISRVGREPGGSLGEGRSRDRQSTDTSESIQADIRLLDATLAMNGVVQMDKDAARAAELYPAEAPWQSPCYLYRGVSSHLMGHPERAVPMLQEAVRHGAVVSPIVEVISLVPALPDRDRGRRLGQGIRPDRPGPRAGTPLRAERLSEHCDRLRNFRFGALPRGLGRAGAGRQRGRQAAAGFLTDFPPWYEAEARLVLSRACIRLDDLASGRVLLDEASALLERTPDAIILSEWLSASRPL